MAPRPPRPGPKRAATNDFQAKIDADREKKKLEDLAVGIFKRGTSGNKNNNNNNNKRSSLPARGAASQPGGSLASRAGVKKRVASSAAAVRPTPTGPRAANDEWTHDRYSNSSRTSSPRPNGSNSLASRITDPSRPAAGNRGGKKQPQQQQQRRTAQVQSALIRSEAPSEGRPAFPPPAAGGRFNPGISIRGLAGPFVVMAQNFAPGTTAADIESAMTPYGGLVTSCRLLKTTPIVIAEIVFESKEGADAVIAKFNNSLADGRLLHVYHKIGGGAVVPQSRPPPPPPPSGPRADRRDTDDDMVIDGSMGFDEPAARERGFVIDTQGSRGNGGLYSDRLVSAPQGRGRGGGGRNGGGRNYRQ